MTRGEDEGSDVWCGCPGTGIKRAIYQLEARHNDIGMFWTVIALPIAPSSVPIGHLGSTELKR